MSAQMTVHWPGVRILSVVFLITTLAVSGNAKATWISKPIVPSFNGYSGQDYQASHDSRYLVFADNTISPESRELFSYSFQNQMIFSLNETLEAEGFVDRFQVSPDNSRVVYLAAREIYYNTFDIYSATIEGEIVTKICGNNCLDFKISADGSRIVYKAMREIVNADDSRSTFYELYSVPIAGGPSVRISSPLNAGVWIGEFKISPDSSRALYVAGNGLNSVPILGGTVTQLNATLLAGETIDSFEISSNAAHVVFRVSSPIGGSDAVKEIYSVPIAGDSPPVRLNQNLVAGGAVSEYQICPDSGYVVYVADGDTDNVRELYRVPITGGGVEKLNFPLATDEWIGSFQVTSDGSSVIYSINQQNDAGEWVKGLYRNSVLGGQQLEYTNSRNAAQFSISSDSSRVVYKTIDALENVQALYSAQIDGSSSVQLNSPLAAGRNIESFKISSDGTYVVYVARAVHRELFEVSARGGVVSQVSSPLEANVNDFLITPNSSRIVYVEGTMGKPNMYEAHRLKRVRIPSLGADDGWVCESSEDSGIGGSSGVTANLRVGDDVRDRQCVSVLSFDTSSIPAYAAVVSATLGLRRAGLVGSDPMNTHKSMIADIKGWAFSGSRVLESSDFQTSASAKAIATVSRTSRGGWYTARISALGLQYINLSRLTQFRLRFSLDDNDDRKADLILFFSGNAADSNRPYLNIVYDSD